jgi:hypothetical protein
MTIPRRFYHQGPMREAPPLRRDSQGRADESSIRAMTGGSKTPATPGHPRVHHERIGDHREPGFHSGNATGSAVDRTSPGRAIHNGRNNGLDR